MPRGLDYKIANVSRLHSSAPPPRVPPSPRSLCSAASLSADELGINKDRYKSLADEMDSTFAELAGY
ncbi:Tropomyosin-1 [Gryllus bimaculatus]|nr:Tropomyosin-1 [Gryllus bimaculatus]